MSRKMTSMPDGFFDSSDEDICSDDVEEIDGGVSQIAKEIELDADATNILANQDEQEYIEAEAAVEGGTSTLDELASLEVAQSSILPTEAAQEEIVSSLVAEEGIDSPARSFGYKLSLPKDSEVADKTVSAMAEDAAPVLAIVEPPVDETDPELARLQALCHGLTEETLETWLEEKVEVTRQHTPDEQEFQEVMLSLHKDAKAYLARFATGATSHTQTPILTVEPTSTLPSLERANIKPASLTLLKKGDSYPVTVNDPIVGICIGWSFPNRENQTINVMKLHIVSPTRNKNYSACLDALNKTHERLPMGIVNRSFNFAGIPMNVKSAYICLNNAETRGESVNTFPVVVGFNREMIAKTLDIALQRHPLTQMRTIDPDWRNRDAWCMANIQPKAFSGERALKPMETFCCLCNIRVQLSCRLGNDAITATSGIIPDFKIIEVSGIIPIPEMDMGVFEEPKTSESQQWVQQPLDTFDYDASLMDHVKDEAKRKGVVQFIKLTGKLRKLNDADEVARYDRIAGQVQQNALKDHKLPVLQQATREAEVAGARHVFNKMRGSMPSRR